MESYCLGDDFLEIRSHKGLKDNSAILILIIQQTLCLERFRPVVSQQRADLVTSEQLHPSGPTSDCHSDAVTIRIGAYDEICLLCLGQSYGHGESLSVFGIRRRDRWEGTIRSLLFGNCQNLESQFPQDRY